MTGILRSWICENARCAAWFDSYEPNPACPSCKCVRVSWRPNGGHIGSHAKSADSELRALVDVFKLGDINSAEAGRAAKKVSLPPAAPASGPVHTFAGGFSAAVDPTRGAQCVPAANKVDFKVKASPGSRLSANASFPDMASHTSVEARAKS